MAIGQFQKGLLGYDPMELKALEQKQWQSLYANAQSPYEKMGIALGQLGGALVGEFMGGASATDVKAKAINEAVAKAGQQYTQGTSEYYKAIADALPAEYVDSKEYATQEYLKTKKAETTTWSDSIKAVKDNPELLTTFQQPLAESLLSKATKKGWSEQDTPVPQTTEEIKAFAKLYDLSNDPDYGRYLALQKIADKEARKETQQEEKRLLDMTAIKSTIAKNAADLNKIEKDAKFDQGDRWNAELAAAQALFKANGLDPTKPLRGINLANTELVNAQKIALREPFTGKSSKNVPPPSGGGKSAAEGGDIKQQVTTAFGSYEPTKYEYRIVNGQVQRKAK
jgi:hypothetical protein